MLVEHALTGDSHVVGPAGPGHPTARLVGRADRPGPRAGHRPVLRRLRQRARRLPGHDGPVVAGAGRRPWGSRFPEVTVGDQVRVEAALADALGIDRWACVVGGSMGGMRALEWAVALPDRVGRAVLPRLGRRRHAPTRSAPRPPSRPPSAPTRAGPAATTTSADPPVAGLGIARRIAHLTYRSAFELGERFGTEVQDDGRFAVASYLDHHADKLARRFDAGSYVVLTEAMNSWDVGRGRGGVEAALARVTARALVAGVDSDRLYPLAQQQQVADALGVPLQVIASPYGHDGFLIEVDAVGPPAAGPARG